MTINGRGSQGDNLEELAALYAAGTLAPEECRALEARVAETGPEAVALLRTFVEVAAALAKAQAVSPPRAVREKLLQRVTGEGAVEHAGLSIVRESDAVWEDLPFPGMQRRILNVDREQGRHTTLVRMAAGASYPAHDHTGVEECLVLEGDLRVGAEVLRAGDYQRATPGSHHVEQTSEGGCLVLIVAPLAS